MRSDSHTTETTHITSESTAQSNATREPSALLSRPTSLGTGSAALWPQVMVGDIVWALRSCYYEGLTRGLLVLVCCTEDTSPVRVAPRETGGSTPNRSHLTAGQEGSADSRACVNRVDWRCVRLWTALDVRRLQAPRKRPRMIATRGPCLRTPESAGGHTAPSDESTCLFWCLWLDSST